MSANNPGPGGVRNLRAIFENKTSDHSTSPPSRGRSPGGSDTSLHSRPVSKVRATFVAVERPDEAGHGQQWGLRKASDAAIEEKTERAIETSFPIREMSQASFNPELPQSTTVVKEFSSRNRSDTGQSKNHDMTLSENAGGLGVILKGSAFEDTAAPAISSAPSQQQSFLTPKPQDNNPPNSDIHSLPPKAQVAIDSKKPEVRISTSKDSGHAKASPSSADHSKLSPKSLPSSKTPKEKTPVSPKTSKSEQNKSAATSKQVAKAPEKEKVKSSSKSPVMSTSDRTIPSLMLKDSERSKAKISPVSHDLDGSSKVTETSPKGKTQPKSPVQTSRLTAAATAPTASSVARAVNGAGHSTSGIKAEKSTNDQIHPNTKLETERTPARIPPFTSSTMTKRPSRASLTSQTAVKDIPKSRHSIASKPPDEGFLARLTRPTASSASKAHEKWQTNSPPKDIKHKVVPSGRIRKTSAKTDEDKITTNGKIEPIRHEASTGDGISAKVNGDVTAEPRAVEASTSG